MLPSGDKREEMSAPVLERHIEITPGVAGGKPRIAGHRITVQDIVIWHERMGRSADEICAEYDLTLADVYAALAYYFDHREEIDPELGRKRSPCSGIASAQRLGNGTAPR